MTPTKKLFDLARAMFKDAWEQRSVQASTVARSYESENAKLQQQINRLSIKPAAAHLTGFMLKLAAAPEEHMHSPGSHR